MPTNNPTPEELAAWRVVCARATPGDWWVRTLTHSKPPWLEIQMVDGLIADVQTWRSGQPGSMEETCANADFIAAARTALPRLIDALEASETKVTRLEAQVPPLGCECYDSFIKSEKETE